MKTLGIVGGVGPESTIEYYRRTIAAYRARSVDGASPSILLNSVDNRTVLGLVAAGELTQLSRYLANALTALHRGGAELALVAANTPHLVFEETQRLSPVPLLSIVEATCNAAKAGNLGRLALLGTRFTMAGSFYPDVFTRRGIELVVPTEAEQAYIHDKYMSELLHGVILLETREELVRIISEIAQRSAIDGVILGGTELSLILREPTASGLPVLDTTQIHVDAAVTQLLA